MRGSIVKKTNKKTGNYTYHVIIEAQPGPDGKRKRLWYSVKGGKHEAEELRTKLLNERATGTLAFPGKVKLGSYLEEWLTGYSPSLAPVSVKNYKLHIQKHINPAIGNISLSNLMPKDVQKLYADLLASGLSIRSVNYVHVTLHKALKTAVRMNLIGRNVTDLVDVPRAKAAREMHVMTEAEVSRILELAKDTPYYALFHLAIFTGARRSELLGLKWLDVDLILSRISINRTLHIEGGKVVFRPTKTARSRRVIALSQSTVDVLRAHGEAQEKVRHYIGQEIKDDDFVFCQADGKPWHPDTITHAWSRLADKAGLDIRLHDCRHTHATLMLKQNVHPAVVAQRLGHSSVKITLDIYSHVLPGMQQAAADSFDKMISHTSK